MTPGETYLQTLGKSNATNDLERDLFVTKTFDAQAEFNKTWENNRKQVAANKKELEKLS